ncbi:MAG: UDP-2,3-diacylglucosamine hydrolase [Bacteroidia bacterium]|nr:MAG: UDP-2,3-diacylglucosamine hydrolase [Bacteroidia bacterium]
MPNKVLIFADFHLGIPNYKDSLQREKKFIHFINAQTDITEIVILGDLFDFWFEYQHVVPKGYFRILSKLAELQENGTQVSVFSGNHDLWLKNYFPDYLNIPVYHQSLIKEWFGKKFFLAHGDGLGPKDYGFKIMKKCFQNRFLQFCFRWLHPDLGISIAQYFSQKSRKSHIISDATYHGDNEWIYQYFIRKSKQLPDVQYFIFGHRHLPIIKSQSNHQTMIVLGDWIHHFSYLEITENSVELKFLENNYEIKH